MHKSALLLALIVSIAIHAQDLKPIQLPAAQTEGGRPLMQVLKERKTRREFSPEKLPLQMFTSFGPPSALTVRMVDLPRPRR